MFCSLFAKAKLVLPIGLSKYKYSKQYLQIPHIFWMFSNNCLGLLILSGSLTNTKTFWNITFYTKHMWIVFSSLKSNFHECLSDCELLKQFSENIGNKWSMIDVTLVTKHFWFVVLVLDVFDYFASFMYNNIYAYQHQLPAQKKYLSSEKYQNAEAT